MTDTLLSKAQQRIIDSLVVRVQELEREALKRADHNLRILKEGALRQNRIDELERDNGILKLALAEESGRVGGLEREVARLKEYAQHNDRCEAGKYDAG